ncbi:MAG: peptide transporter permease protein [Microbacterium sp.]|jgi:peptide/nickel transport system permease protein|uniref:ABC transporter permease n=1 Tax=Microbacterium sp. TaxID=51671 RepID=UPI0026062723|nr:ABC transporter permease [Microbacterium sp.]MDF2560249.1 peptide transporter permease protein [Microbacterium sp.]
MGFLARRLAVKLLLVFVAASLAYLLASIALDPAKVYLDAGREVPREAILAALDRYNVNPDVPLLQRYATWLAGVARGDFGLVFQTGDPVSEVLLRRMGVSLRLLLVGTVLAVVLGVVIGVLGAARQYRVDDHVTTIVAFVLLSTPVFLLANFLKFGGDWVNATSGTVLVYFDGEYHTGPDAGLVERAQHLLLPTLALVLGPAGVAFFSRYQRSAMLDVLGSEFITTARAKGLTKRRAFFAHGLRVALIPMATFFAFTFGLLITGATFVEKVFNWNGMGQWAVDSIKNSDVNAIAAITLVVAVLVMISGMLADIIHAFLDPRVRTTQRGARA